MRKYKVSYEVFSANHLEDVVQFLATVLYNKRKSVPVKTLLAFYQWKYFGARMPVSRVPGFLAREAGTGRIIGFIGCPPFLLNIDFYKAPFAAWITDWFVDAAYTGRGIGTRLLQMAQQELEILCGTQFTDVATEIMRKNNFSVCQGYYQVLRVLRPFDYFFKIRKGWRKIISAVAWGAYHLKFQSKQVLGRGGVKFNPITLLEFLQIYSAYPYQGLKRSAEYFNWLENISLFKLLYFEVAVSADQRERIGLCLLRGTDAYGRNVGKIIDVTPLRKEDAGRLYSGLFQSNLMEGLDYIICNVTIDQCEQLSGNIYFYRKYPSSFWYPSFLTELSCNSVHHQLIDKDGASRMIQFVA